MSRHGIGGETGYLVAVRPGGTELGKLYAMSTENLRREARVDVRVPVVVYRGKRAVSLETSDVSFKGLFVRTTDPPALRSLVRLKVALFDREFEAHAMAVHVVVPGQEGEHHQPGVGLQFWGLSGPDRTAWDDFVRGLVQARRAAAKKSGESVHPALSEPPTPSGVHIVVKAPHFSSK
jgi:hypothetical protein